MGYEEKKKFNMATRRSKQPNNHGEEVATVRGGCGGTAAKSKSDYLLQVKGVNETCLQRRANMNVAKTRDRDLFPEGKRQQGASDTLPQVNSQQRGQAKFANKETSGKSLSYGIKWEKENWNRKTLTESKKIEAGTSAILRRVGAHIASCAHLIGKPKFSKNENRWNQVFQELQ